MQDGVVTVNLGQSLETIKSKLPTGYSIVDSNGNKITDNSIIIGTGMKILNSNGKVVGKVLTLGDLNEDGEPDTDDASIILSLIAGDIEIKEDYKKVAMDVNNDGKINKTDSDLILSWYNFEITEFPDEGFEGGASLIVIEKD